MVSKNPHVIPIEGAKEMSDRAEGSCTERKSRSEHGKRVCFLIRLRARFLHSAGFALLGRNDKEDFLLRDPFDFAGATVLPLLRSG